MIILALFLSILSITMAYSLWEESETEDQENVYRITNGLERNPNE